ncbi:hypothetical protein KA005_06685 [bacterium]|nr:hypothetical protein [bacterium]
MFLDDEFYEICKSGELEDIPMQLHNVITKHIQEQLFDKPGHCDDDLIIVFKRIEKQFKNAVKRLEIDGINRYSPEFIPLYFKKLFPEVAIHIWT